MALFMIHALDKPDSLGLRMANREAHLAWAGKMGEAILMAGPLLAEDGETLSGSAFVVEMDSLDAVKSWHATDPYVMAGLFDRVAIRPFRWLIGEGKPT